LLWIKTVKKSGKKTLAYCYASPAITKTLFMQFQKYLADPFTAQTQLVALKIDTGEKLWNKTIGDIYPDNYKFAAYNTPTVADDMVYVVSPDGYLYALDYLTGKQKWDKQVYDKGFLTNIYLTSSPLMQTGFYILVLQKDILWHRHFRRINSIDLVNVLKSPIFSSPIVVDGLVFITAENGMLECLAI